MTPNYFEDIRRELVAAAERENQLASSPQRRRRRRMPWLAVVVLALVPVGATAAAIWQPWTEGDGLQRQSPTETLQRGSLTRGGSWELVTFESSAGRCLELLLHDASVQLPTRAGGCGAPSAAIASIGGPKSATGLLFGEVPARAAQVTYRASGAAPGAAVTAQTTPIWKQHRYFVIEAQGIDPDGCVTVTDADANILQSGAVSSVSQHRCP